MLAHAVIIYNAIRMCVNVSGLPEGTNPVSISSYYADLQIRLQPAFVFYTPTGVETESS